MLAAELSELKAQMQAEKSALESLSQQHLVAREARHASILAEQGASLCLPAFLCLFAAPACCMSGTGQHKVRGPNITCTPHSMLTGSTAEELAETKLAAQASCQVSVLHHHFANCIKYVMLGNFVTSGARLLLAYLPVWSQATQVDCGAAFVLLQVCYMSSHSASCGPAGAASTRVGC